VPAAANGQADQTSVECRRACCSWLLKITSGQLRLILDDGFHIFTEYRSYLSLRGQPGVGDAFFRWVHDHQFNPEQCERVALTEHPSRGYSEFPDDPELADFDWGDRKFVAAARASSQPGCVLNALDSDWWDYERVLARNGVEVEFACADQLAAWRRGRPQRP
jgi:hypothetical protein